MVATYLTASQEVHLENQPVNREVKSQLPNSSPSPSKTTQTNSQPSRETLQGICSARVKFQEAGVIASLSRS